jgi:hypothetical protein
MSTVLLIDFDRSNCVSQPYLPTKPELFGMMPNGFDDNRFRFSTRVALRKPEHLTASGCLQFKLP